MQLLKENFENEVWKRYFMLRPVLGEKIMFATRHSAQHWLFLERESLFIALIGSAKVYTLSDQSKGLSQIGPPMHRRVKQLFHMDALAHALIIYLTI